MSAPDDLCEAQREVDEMLPNTPPIAPPRRSPKWGLADYLHFLGPFMEGLLIAAFVMGIGGMVFLTVTSYSDARVREVEELRDRISRCSREATRMNAHLDVEIQIVQDRLRYLIERENASGAERDVPLAKRLQGKRAGFGERR